MVYLDIPHAPDFSDPETIDPTDTNITTPDLNGKTDLILGAGVHTPNITLTNLIGTEETPIRVKGAAYNPRVTEVGSDDLAASAMHVSGCEWVEIYDIFFRQGHSLKHQSNSENILFQNIIFDGEENVNGFAGFMSKTDGGGGTVTPYLVVGSFSFLKNTDGEGIYIGETTGTTFHNIARVNLFHIGGFNFGWDCCQFIHVTDVDVYNLTLLEGARLDETNQNRNLQFIDSKGTVKNSFFSTLGTVGTVYCAFGKADNYTFKNCYFEGQDLAAIFTGAAESWWSVSTNKGNGTVIYDSCILKITSAGTYAAQVTMDYGHVIIKNCLILNTRSQIFDDGRTDTTTYSLIDGGGNQFVASGHPAMNPTFDDEKKVTSVYHYRRAMGWRTPIEGKYPTIGTATITGTAEIGQTLTASASDLNAGGGLAVTGYLYQWYRSDDASGTNRTLIPNNAQSKTYEVVSGDGGKFLDVEIQAINDVDLAGDATMSAKTAQVPAGASANIHIGFGDYSGSSGDPTPLAPASAINNCNIQNGSNGAIADLVDINGDPTGIGFEVDNHAVISGGSNGTSGDTALFTAQTKQYYQSEAFTSNVVTYRFTGLNDADTFTIRCLHNISSGGATNRGITVRAGGSDVTNSPDGTYTVQAKNNETEEVLTGLTTDGAGNLEIEWQPKDTGNNAVFNALEFEIE